MSAPISAYPLTWPTGWKRTTASERRSGNFSKGVTHRSEDGQRSWQSYEGLSIAQATARVLKQLDRMPRVLGVVISTNVELRRDGLPRSDRRMPADPGVAVYWEDVDTASRRCMAIDLYDKVEQNLAAIAATLDAMRAIERHGGAAILDRAFTGFTALPAPITGQKPWREVLGVQQNESGHLIVEEAYRRKRGEAHPDRKGGDHDEFLAVQAAYEQAARELGFTP